MEITLENIDYDKEQNSFLLTFEINGKYRNFIIDAYSCDLIPDLFDDITENQYEALDELSSGLVGYVQAMGIEQEENR